MKKLLQKFLSYNRSVRNGILCLLFASILVLLLPNLYPYFVPEPQVDFTEMESLVSEVKEAQQVQKKSYTKSKKSETFPFNPNLIPKEDFIRLGLSPKVAQTIINYRNKGGKFYKKEDLKKIYGIQGADYQRLESFIILEKRKKYNKKYNPKKVKSNIAPPPKPLVLFPFDPNTVSEEDLKRMGFATKIVSTILKFRARGSFRKAADFGKIYGISESEFKQIEPFIQIAKKEKKDYVNTSKPKVVQATKKTYTPTTVDINKANVEEWQKIKGIGPTFAKRIVKFRDKLGGFGRIDQIGETYGLADSSFQKIRPFLTIEDKPELRQINVNTVNEKELKAHLYFDWKKATTLINYRTHHGDFKSIEDVKKILSFKADFIKKIEPYLTYD